MTVTPSTSICRASMRPPSSPSDPQPAATGHGRGGRGLFDELQARGGVHDAVSDAAWLQALLDAEAALAAVQADEGLIPHAHAAAIGQLCRADLFDISELAQAAAHTSTHRREAATTGDH